MSDSEPLEFECAQGREIGNEAFWSLSSAKPGNGIDQLRDDKIDTFWQSDGAQPHCINIEFNKKTLIQEIAFYLYYKLDESYTPKRISIRSGNTVQDLVEIHLQELVEPNGWVRVPLHIIENGKHRPLRTFFLQIVVLAMHQNGRDTHIRQIKIYSPRETNIFGPSTIEPTTAQISAYFMIR
ncbi:hypothetical protein ABG067_005123 [Albugo candida]|uniref:Anaphase-promoting complex subunit 10 n=1 Tax=Albugo candida TaxID=65357 RepID=A0A024GFW6_9STRA|nr:unnamed protein product [Albugo candida]|eukprot:CCI45658.1 unnamed protein product [Albugo candida]